LTQAYYLEIYFDHLPENVDKNFSSLYFVYLLATKKHFPFFSNMRVSFTTMSKMLTHAAKGCIYDYGMTGVSASTSISCHLTGPPLPVKIIN